MKKRIITLFLLVIIVSMVYGEIIDWGIHTGLQLSNNIGKDNRYSLNYNIYQNFTMLDTTNQSNNLIKDKILVGSYLKESTKIKSYPTFSAGAFLCYRISEERNVFIFQPEINWMRYSLEFEFDNDSQNVYFEGQKTYILADSTTYEHNYTGKNIMSLVNNVRNKVTASVDFIKIPLLLKVQREFGEGNAGFIYAGPSFGFKILNETKILNNLKDTFDSYSDQDSLTTYTSERILNSIDEINPLQFSAVFGFGWKFNKVFGVGLGKDYLTIDLRNELGLNYLSNLSVNNKLKFYSFNLIAGYHF